MNCIVTIGIPVYNSQDYIFETIKSVLVQTYSEIELLIVDDGSSDKSLDIICDIQNNYACEKIIRVLKQPANLGVSATRNRIIDEAHGKYLFFLDSDDLIIGDNTISLMVNHAQRIDADLVIGSYEKKWIDNSGKTEKYQYDRHDFIDEDAFAKYAYRKYAGVQASACNYLMKLCLIRSINLRFYDAVFLEDFIFTHELVTCVKRVVTLPDLTYCYQFHENSLSHSQLRDKIPKQEISKTVQGIGHLKDLYKNLYSKPYFSSQMCYMLKTDFFIVCSILRNGKIIEPSFNVDEMKYIMCCPLSFKDIVGNNCRWWNMFFFIVGLMPAPLCVFVLKMVGKMKGLI